MRTFFSPLSLDSLASEKNVEEREKERERGSNLRRQRLASPTAQVLVALQRLYLSLRAVCSAAILLFVLRRFVLAASSACFFPFFLPPPNPQSTVSVRT